MARKTKLTKRQRIGKWVFFCALAVYLLARAIPIFSQNPVTENMLTMYEYIYIVLAFICTVFMLIGIFIFFRKRFTWLLFIPMMLFYNWWAFYVVRLVTENENLFLIFGGIAVAFTIPALIIENKAEKNARYGESHDHNP